MPPQITQNKVCAADTWLCVPQSGDDPSDDWPRVPKHRGAHLSWRLPVAAVSSCLSLSRFLILGILPLLLAIVAHSGLLWSSSGVGYNV